jgi:hypothetical protein
MHMFGAGQDTSFKAGDVPGGVGIACAVHVVPFQWRPASDEPFCRTVVQLVVDAHETATPPAASETVHVVPFHNQVALPVAMHIVLLAHERPVASDGGAAMIDHVLPFHCSANTWKDGW